MQSTSEHSMKRQRVDTTEDAIAEGAIRALKAACLKREDLLPHEKQPYFSKLVRQQFARIRGSSGDYVVFEVKAAVYSNSRSKFVMVGTIPGNSSAEHIEVLRLSNSPPTDEECRTFLKRQGAKGKPLQPSDVYERLAEKERVLRDRKHAQRVGERWWGENKEDAVYLLFRTWQYTDTRPDAGAEESKATSSKQDIELAPRTLRERTPAAEGPLSSNERSDMASTFRASLEESLETASDGAKFCGEFAYILETKGGSPVLPFQTAHFDYDEQQPDLTAWRGVRRCLGRDIPLAKFRAVGILSRGLPNKLEDSGKRVYVVDVDALLRANASIEPGRVLDKWVPSTGHDSKLSIRKEHWIRQVLESSSPPGTKDATLHRALAAANFAVDLAPQRQQKPQEMFHGTSASAAELIQKQGFKRPKCRLTPLCLNGRCQCQMLGFGVYFATKEKAMEFAAKRAEKAENGDPRGGLLRCEVDLGHCKAISPSQPQKCPCGCGKLHVDHLGAWYGWHGFDSVFVPDNCQPIATLREWCVADPRRIKVVDVTYVTPTQ